MASVEHKYRFCGGSDSGAITLSAASATLSIFSSARAVSAGGVDEEVARGETDSGHEKESEAAREGKKMKKGQGKGEGRERKDREGGRRRCVHH